jgi:hypothetical protein
MDRSFDELGLLELGHGIVPPLELSPRQAVTALQGWNRTAT